MHRAGAGVEQGVLAQGLRGARHQGVRQGEARLAWYRMEFYGKNVRCLCVLSAIAVQVPCPAYWRGVDDTGPYKTAYMTYEAGLTHDPENAELKSGHRRAKDAFEKTISRISRAAADPEIFAIMSDPAMRPVGRCRLTVSKPELKPRLVSAISA